jgi:LynF/TruF/PatF family peptide O-prenyltransferase
MSSTSVFQENYLREKNLQFIRAHQIAFDVEPIFPLPLFEEFVANAEGDCGIEASCKIEVDRLIASRFLLFFDRSDKAVSPANKLAKVLDFFHQVGNRVGANIDYNLLDQFIDRPNCLNTVMQISCGVDLRSTLSESSLKTHFRLDFLDQPANSILDLIDFALSLSCLDDSSMDLLNTFNPYIPRHKLIPQVGFDFFLNGSTEVELYLEITEEYFNHPQVWQALQYRFSEKILSPLEVSDFFHIGLSKVNSNPVLYYRLKNKRNLTRYFSTNVTADRVVSFYQQQTTRPDMWIAASEENLGKQKLDSVKLYYSL